MDLTICGHPRPLKTVSTDWLAKRFGFVRNGVWNGNQSHLGLIKVVEGR